MKSIVSFSLVLIFSLGFIPSAWGNRGSGRINSPKTKPPSTTTVSQPVKK